jgi:multidrug efflux system outer membrane protein
LVIIVLLVLAGGCALGPNYKRPAVGAPENFRFATSQTTNSIGDLPWWQTFKDPILQDLIRTALTNNYDLKQAVARVEQARNQWIAVRSPLFPQIGYGGDVGRGRNAILNQPTPLLNGAVQSSAQVNANVFWEIDFWGRIRRLSEAARAQYLATEDARRGVMITLLSDVATAYLQLLDLDQELQILRSATNAYAGTYRIFNDRRINGVASKLETDRAAASLANAAAGIPPLQLQIATTENQINLLLGRSPGPVARRSLADQPPAPPDIPAGLPSDLLRRRPDVLGAEQSLVAANANIGVSVADFFPRIGLTAFLGRVSPSLSAFTAGSANMWNFGAEMAGPLFQGGRLRAQYRGAKAAFEEAKAAYRQSVLTAFQDVSNALISRQKQGETRIYDEQAVVSLTESVQLATERYVNGRSSYFEVLQAQEELYPAERAQVQAQTGELIAIVQLYRALGGGWQPSP